MPCRAVIMLFVVDIRYLTCTLPCNNVLHSHISVPICSILNRPGFHLFSWPRRRPIVYILISKLSILSLVTVLLHPLSSRLPLLLFSDNVYTLLYYNNHKLSATPSNRLYSTVTVLELGVSTLFSYR